MTPPLLTVFAFSLSRAQRFFTAQGVTNVTPLASVTPVFYFFPFHFTTEAARVLVCVCEKTKSVCDVCCVFVLLCASVFRLQLPVCVCVCVMQN